VGAAIGSVDLSRRPGWSTTESFNHMDESVLFRDEIVSISFLRNRSMSIDWMNSLIIVTFMSVWVLIGQFSFIKQ
jgi:hypothetical protein